MSLKSLLFAATLASSSVVSGAEPHHPVEQTKGHTSQKVHDSLEHTGKHALHPHVEISAGFERNHLLDHGQLMKGDFSSLGIHASLEDWWAYYHWLQAQDSSLEHKAGITYSKTLHPGFVLRAGLSGIYEVVWSEHGASHGPAHKNEPSGHDEHEKKEPVHAKEKESEPVLESTLYAAASLELEAILAQNKHSKILWTVGWEYDFGVLDTSFVHAWIEYIHDIGGVQLTTQAKVIHVLGTKSSHVETWTLWVLDAGARIPLSKNWSLDFWCQFTTRGDTTGRAMATWKF
jgi:hypothetical protein